MIYKVKILLISRIRILKKKITLRKYFRLKAAQPGKLVKPGLCILGRKSWGWGEKEGTLWDLIYLETRKNQETTGREAGLFIFTAWLKDQPSIFLQSLWLTESSESLQRRAGCTCLPVLCGPHKTFQIWPEIWNNTTFVGWSDPSLWLRVKFVSREIWQQRGLYPLP